MEQGTSGVAAAWPTTTNTQKTIRYYPGKDREFRVRSRDKAGNWSTWDYLKVGM